MCVVDKRNCIWYQIKNVLFILMPCLTDKYCVTGKTWGAAYMRNKKWLDKAGGGGAVGDSPICVPLL